MKTDKQSAFLKTFAFSYFWFNCSEAKLLFDHTPTFYLGSFINESPFLRLVKYSSQLQFMMIIQEIRYLFFPTEK